MKILVLSDSHSALSFMRLCMDVVKPDAVIHLGDHYDDGEAIAEEYSGIPMYQVPGNCDRYRCTSWIPEIRIEKVFGVNLYMTHGHKHSVKSDTGRLISAAHASKAQAVLYGHTHVPECYQDPYGMWVLNPGSCGYYGGSAGIIRIDDQKITYCGLIRQQDLEEFS